MKEYQGKLLCEACWNGNHYSHEHNPRTGKPIMSKPVSGCLRGDCQCLCVAKMEDLKLEKVRAAMRHSQLREEKKLQSMLFGGEDE